MSRNIFQIEEDNPLEEKIGVSDHIFDPEHPVSRYMFFKKTKDTTFPSPDYESGPCLFIADGESENKAAINYLKNFYKKHNRLPIWFDDITEFISVLVYGKACITGNTIPGNDITFNVFKDQIIKMEEK